jgi:hypothetical protein
MLTIGGGLWGREIAVVAVAPSPRSESGFGQLGDERVVSTCVLAIGSSFFFFFLREGVLQHARYHTLVLLAPWNLVQLSGQRQLLLVLLLCCPGCTGFCVRHALIVSALKSSS